MAAIEHRKIERCEQPFVRIEHERIRPLAAVQNVPHFRNDGGRTSVRGVDMQPHDVSLADFDDCRYGINAGSRSRAHCRDHAKWKEAIALVFVDCVGEGVRVHPKLVISRNLA